MMLLTLHVIAIGLLVLVVGTVAYRLGYDKAERRYRRAMERKDGERKDGERQEGNPS